MHGPLVVADLNTSTASLVEKPTSGIPRFMKEPLRLKTRVHRRKGYHLMEDMTNKTIKWIGQQKSLAPEKPFFIYFAPGATHAPHHVPS